MIPATSAIGLAMVVPVYLEMAQWALLLLLGLLVIIMFRQLGRLFNFAHTQTTRAASFRQRLFFLCRLRRGLRASRALPYFSQQTTMMLKSRSTG